MPGEPWLGWARPHLERFLGDAGEILFLPFAAADFSYDEHRPPRRSLPTAGLWSAHPADPAASSRGRGRPVAGGGNTFCLPGAARILAYGPMRAAVEA